MKHATLKPGGGRGAGRAPLQLFYGDLHRHSNVSRCLEGVEARPLDRYVFARRAWHEDFFALTDHPGHADPLQAWNLCKLVDLAGSPDFCVFPGLRVVERTVRPPERDLPPPHRFSRRAARRLRDAGAALGPPAREGGDHHPAPPGPRPHRDGLEPLRSALRAAGRGRAGGARSYEFDGCFRVAESAGTDANFVQDALEQGLEFGLVSSSDHGNGATYAVVLAERLEGNSIFDALWDRRTSRRRPRG